MFGHLKLYFFCNFNTKNLFLDECLCTIAQMWIWVMCWYSLCTSKSENENFIDCCFIYCLKDFATATLQDISGIYLMKGWVQKGPMCIFQPNFKKTSTNCCLANICLLQIIFNLLKGQGIYQSLSSYRLSLVAWSC